MSDRCASSLGRRRPFIIGGAFSIAFYVLLIGYSADVGHMLGDPGSRETRYGAIAVYLVRFYLRDVGNNTTQGPCRALLADLPGKDHRTWVDNACLSLSMVLAYWAIYLALLPVILIVVLLMMTTCISVLSASEIPLFSDSRVMTSVGGTQMQLSDNGHEAFLYLKLPVWMVLIVCALTWIGWFPFTLFDNDWMGQEIYKVDPNEGIIYQDGVRMVPTGLMLNSIVLGFTSVALERFCRKFGAGLTCGVANIIVFFCFIGMFILSSLAKNMDYPPNGLPPNGLAIAALVIFTILGAPLAVTYTIPVISSRIESLGLGQGWLWGFLNLAIVIPQGLSR